MLPAHWCLRGCVGNVLVCVSERATEGVLRGISMTSGAPLFHWSGVRACRRGRDKQTRPAQQARRCSNTPFRSMQTTH